MCSCLPPFRFSLCFSVISVASFLSFLAGRCSVLAGYAQRQSGVSVPYLTPRIRPRPRDDLCRTRPGPREHPSLAVVLRKVQVRELPVQLPRLAVAGLGRRDGIVEPPEIVMLPARGDPRLPVIAAGVDADEPGRAAVIALVHLVLPSRADPQVLPAIVPDPVVLVVHVRALRRVHDLAVHVDGPPILAPPHRIHHPALVAGAPLVPIEFLVVLRIDDHEVIAR